MRRSGFIDCFSGDPLQGRDATRLPVFPNRWFQSERLEDEITGEVHQLDEFGYDPHKDVVVVRGAGQALDTARRGDADVVFVHAKPREEKFLEAGRDRYRSRQRSVVS